MPHEWFWGFTAVSSDQWRWCGCDPWLGTPPLTITKLLWGSNGISNVPRRAFKTLKDVQTYGIIKLGSNLTQGIEVAHDVITSFTNFSFRWSMSLEPGAGCSAPHDLVKEQTLTRTSMEPRQSTRRDTKGSNISRTCSLEDLILEVLRLRCSN